MKLIIDAYNVLKQVCSHLYIADKERTQFIRQITAYAHKKNIEVLVVFDGAPSDNQASIQHVGKVMVIYAGHTTQADTFIQKYVKKYKEHELLLVSTDRELCAWVAQYNVQSIDALDFYAMLRQTQQRDTLKKGGDNKATKLDADTKANATLDQLMEEAADQIMIKNSEDDESINRSSPSYTPSKKERTLLKKIKKL